MKETGATWTEGCYYAMDPVQSQLFIFEKVASWNRGDDFSTVRIRARMDRNGNRLTYSYAGENALVPTEVADGLGRTLTFTYSGIRLSQVTDQSGRFITLTKSNYENHPCGSPTLISVTDAGAYDPCGRVLARTGTTPRLFTFAGTWGGSAGRAQAASTRCAPATTMRQRR